MEYSQPVKIPDGRYYLKITKGGERVFFQLNKVKLASDSLTDSKNFNFALSEHSQAIISAVEQDLVAQAISSKNDWFGRDSITEATIAKAYQSALEGNLLQAPLATVNGKVVTIAYDSEKKSVDLDSIQKNTSLDMLVELSGLWFLKKSFGPIFRVAQIRTSMAPRQKKTFPTKYLFDDTQDEDEEEDEESVTDYLE